MRGFDDYHQAYKAMTDEIIAASDRPMPSDVPHNHFECGDRVWWVADDSQNHALSFCERGVIHMTAPLPLEDSGQWEWQYCITVDMDSPSGEWLHYCLIWEHELLKRVMAHFSSKSSQYVNNGQL